VGGFFLWLQLPPPLLARDVVAAAEATHGVTAMVGERCSPTGPAGLLVQDRLRLCFAFLPVEELIEGQSVSQSVSQSVTVFLSFFSPLHFPTLNTVLSCTIMITMHNMSTGLSD
jgi:hypothetical protein